MENDGRPADRQPRRGHREDIPAGAASRPDAPETKPKSFMDKVWYGVGQLIATGILALILAVILWSAADLARHL